VLLGLAVSGGVDSMALALLCSQARTRDPWFKVADFPARGFYAFVVDHKIRKTSTEEALRVVDELAKLPSVKPKLLTLEWGDVRPSRLPNLETVARRKRYTLLGNACANQDIDNLLLGHHADDVHETVLMRILGGHYGRGLKGIARSNDIPECFGLMRVHKSGLREKLARKRPILSFKPGRRYRSHLRRQLLEVLVRSEAAWGEDLSGEASGQAIEEGYYDEILEGAYPEVEEISDEAFRDDYVPPGQKPPKPDLPHLHIEGLGVQVRRPLLDFEKDRLVATCESNGVQWVEDASNDDRTLTTRNAIRHMVRNYSLPEALQRPAILRMAAAIMERCEEDDEEVKALVSTSPMELSPNVGTLLAEMPLTSKFDDLETLERKRTVAALYLRELMAVVSPDEHLPPVSKLQNTVSSIFPAFATDSHPAQHKATPFTVGHVQFNPVVDPTPPPMPEPTISSDKPISTKWQLCRALPARSEPVQDLAFLMPRKRAVGFITREKWIWQPRPWQLFDGRFWISLTVRMNGNMRVRPFSPTHAAAFRASLSEEDARKLDKILHAHASATLRWTLPAIYVEGRVDWGDNYLDMDPSVLTMLALPTLGIGVKGIEKLLRWETRYKKLASHILDVATLPNGNLAGDQMVGVMTDDVSSTTPLPIPLLEYHSGSGSE